MANLLKERRFLPYFITQFSGAFNDNLFKNSMVTLMVFDLISQAQRAESLALLAGAVFSVPFFLFSANAGQIADKFPKYRCIKWLKAIEMALACLALTSLVLHSITLMFICLFLFATHSSYYGPIKYAILPEYLEKNELIKGNAIVESGTFIAILCGTLIGTYLVSLSLGTWLVGSLCVLFACVGWLACQYIPEQHSANHHLKVDINIFRPFFGILKYTYSNRRVFIAIMGISWFWFIGSTLIVQLPAFVKYTLHADQTVLTSLLAIFTIFVAVGCQLSNRLLKSEIDGRYCAFSMLGIAYFMINLGGVSLQAQPALFQFTDLLFRPMFQRVVLDMSIISILMGVFIVPLFAIMQHDTPTAYRARVVAGNNIINALFMALSPLIAMLLVSHDFTVTDVFAFNGWLNIPAALIITVLIPFKTVKVILQVVLKLLFRVKVRGLENLSAAKQPVVIVANHSSFLDVPILAAFLPGSFLFAVNTEIAKKWWVKWPSKIVQTFPLDPTQPMQTKSLIRKITEGHSCIIFPEGRLTVTGGLMKMYDGSAMIAEHAQVPICPIWIDGAQFSRLTHLKGKVRQRLFPKITVSIQPCTTLALPKSVRGRQRRTLAGQKLQILMTDLMHQSLPFSANVWHACLRAARRYGRHTRVLEDVYRQPLSYQKLILRVQVLSKWLQRHTDAGRLGFLLPNMSASVVTLLAGFASQRVWAILNYSAGTNAVLQACKTAAINQMISSKKFVETAKLEPLIQAIQAQGIHVFYLEDIAQDISVYSRCCAWFKSFCSSLSTHTVERHDPVLNEPAVVLFTSGSEGAPKGVVLSHKNLQENCHQVLSCIDFNHQDVLFNALPIFHAFGLTVATIMPLLRGIKQFVYVSPLHYRVIPEWIYETSATLLVGTNTFLYQYQKAAHPYDFQSIRYVFAGAEKLKPATIEAWSERFGIRIFEGYGATETSPVAAINTPIFNQKGSVGRLLPGMEYRLERDESMPHGGRLWLKGNNIMLGYIKSDKPGVIQPPKHGWYDTGDIVEVSDQGYITIIGRAKRFAKLAGEMVSLEAVEQAVSDCFPQASCAVITIPDIKKGEALVLCVEAGDITMDMLRAYWQAEELAELMLPRQLIDVREIPRLATGKVNYPLLTEMIRSDTEI